MALKDKFIVHLTAGQRQELERLAATGKRSAATITRARILLKADADGDGWPDDRIAEALDTSAGTVARLRKKFVQQGLEATVQRKRPTGRQYRKLDGAQEARLAALACSAPPEGLARWTMKLLADKLVELDVVESIDPATVCRTLKKNEIKPWLKQQWVLPPKANAGFVAAMEDVLEVYAQPHDPKRPQVCFDEGGKQLIGEVRPPLPVRPGSPRREDYEYERNGTANLFMVFEPLAGTRHVEVTERRTNQDFARMMQRLVDEWYPEAEKIVLVMDNLSTHTPAALYEAFEPAEARRLVEKLEWHYTPKHGSWLNVAEMELSVLARQCLDRRIPDLETLRQEVAAWQQKRNAAVVKVDWQFTTADARVKLKRLYPTIQLQ
ncbi:MAG TPA: IS630 family transposase [Gemmataceae bacterium]|nr:IS630 family transposase [Gemmataceae bacterium]